MSAPIIQVEAIDPFVLSTKTRFPFKYGIASMTAAPHLFLRTRLIVNGTEGVGVAAESLPPKWFTKDPSTTFEEDLPALYEVISHAASLVTGASGSYFDIWQSLYADQHRWAAPLDNIPPLLANLGISLVERSILDALCRTLETTFPQAVAENILGIRLGEVRPELEGFAPADLLPSSPLSEVIARHTIGLADPLVDDDIDEPLGDGLPHSLSSCIAAYGLDHFKIKLCGDLDLDRSRLKSLQSVFAESAPADYRFTLDGNEQFSDLETLRTHWENWHEDPDIRTLFDHLLFVEQPLHRDRALGDDIAAAITAWPDAPPLIIDESEADLESLPRALHLGYAGTSHKNCKGIVKGIVNACLLEQLRRQEPSTEFILSGEDLGNIGPIPLLQDLTMMSVLGIPHVERNGHHYYKGLSMFPADVQDTVLEHHPDLYRRHPEGFATLNIENGRLRLSSLLESPFGTRPLLDVESLSSEPKPF